MLYVGVRMYDREPDAIVARELREDEEMINDDIFTVAIDSMLDRKNAFLFYLNALGTKGDARIENNTSFRVNGTVSGTAPPAGTTRAGSPSSPSPSKPCPWM